MRRTEPGSLASASVFVQMWRRKLPILDPSGDCRLLSFVERAIVIRVVPRNISMHFGDVWEHHVGGWPLPLRRGVGRELQRAIGNGFPECFLFRLVQLAVLVGVKRCDLRE